MKEFDPAEKIASMSTKELTARRDQFATRVANGAQYSEGEMRQVQEELNPESPESAREILFITDVLEQQLIAEELKKRSGAS